MIERMMRFEVPGRPRGKGRPRFFRMGKGVGTYNDDRTAAYENLIRLAFTKAYPDHVPASKAMICLSFHAIFPIPKSASKAKREAMISGRVRPTSKPDLKNILAAVEDGLNGVAYLDDAQIVDFREIGKWYGERPRLVVDIEVMREGQA
jgi:Holliday junction resolvase RusA-like endonuclease